MIFRSPPGIILMTLPCANADPPPNVSATATIIDSATFTNSSFHCLALIQKIYRRLTYRGSIRLFS